jgi:uncharacterized membrane protein
MDQSTIDEGKTIAIISYVTLLGTLIAYFMNKDKNNEFAKFHIGQALRAWLAGIVISIIGTVLVMVTGIGILGYLSYAGMILAILGLINAVNGKTEKIPLVGNIGG